MSRIVFNMVICLCLHFIAEGQSYFAKVLEDELGFGQSQVSTIIEDQEGFIWIGTYLGLFRFDGLQSVAFRPEKDNPNSMSSEFVYKIYEDNSRYLWIATRNGLTRIDPSRKIFTRYKHDSEDIHSIPNNRIFDLQLYTDSTLLLSCDRSGLCEFNMNSGKVSRLNPDYIKDTGDKIEDVWPVNTYISNKRKVFIQSGRGFLAYDEAQNVLKNVIDTVTGFHQIKGKRSFFASRDSSIWFVDDIGLLYRWMPLQSMRSYGDATTRSLIKAGLIKLFDFNRQYILVSTHKSYFLADRVTGEIKPFSLREDQDEILLPQSISACRETRAGIILLGLRTGEFLMIDPLMQHFKFKKIIHGDPELRFQISDIQDDHEFQRRYIAVFSDSVFFTEHLISGEWNIHPKVKGSGVTNEWLMDHAGRLWHTNGPMLMEVDRKQGHTKAYYPSVPAIDLSSMEEIAPGRILVGSFREGLFLFEKDKGVFDKVPETKGWIRTQVFSMKYDPGHSSVWIGTVRNGLFRYDMVLDTFIQYRYNSRNPHSLGGDWVRDITFDSLGFIWFATDPIGLSRFDYNAPADSAFLNFTMENGLPSSHIGGIVTDRKGMLWMSSLNGIAELNPADLSIRIFNEGDGLLQTFSSGSNVFITRDNTIMLGMQQGYYYFSPDELMTNVTPPGFVIHDIQVFDRSIKLAYQDRAIQPISLTHKENFITFRFSVINLTEAEKNSVKYKMEGLEDQWNFRTGIHEVKYTNIPPGDYVFRIFAANNDGVWNDQETRITVNIKPPFWQRTWFYLMLAVFGAGTIRSWYQFRLSQSIRESKLMAEKEALRTTAEKQMAELEMTALRAQMNPHFIFNCLNSINRFIIINDNDAASSYLTKFAKLIRQVLDNSRGEKIALSAELETLQLYIEMESLRFADKFEYIIDVDPSLLAQPYAIQPMLIQPYVENAIWHGLMHRKSRGKLILRFLRFDNALQVEIEDNGVGREKARQIKASQLVRKQSHGMKVTAERMSLLSKKLQVPVEARVEDLYDVDFHASGTRVILTLPLEWSPDDSAPSKLPTS